ncbi:O-antigen translocase [Photobacterium iliopiscarium]|uniref:O-antigen translocase n=1 Tax=Photobacterium iliopiscarium TaxID=56192 RepID=UPI00242C8DF8|nr:O-antigen translocase [Photobacterium iliopiscarium]
MNIVKASVYSFISTVVKMLSGLVINKAISIFVGPSGLALIGQLQNASGIIQVISSGGIANGIIKYTAENENRSETWSTGLRITLIFSILSTVILLFFSEKISVLFFHTAEYQFVILILGVMITLFSLNQFVLSIITGLGSIKLYTVINIIQSFYSLILTVTLIYFYSVNGALVAMVTNQAIVFFIVLYKIRSNKDIKLSMFKHPFNKSESRKLFSYSLMTLVSALTLPLSLVLIRNYIGSQLSWDYAGYWQAMSYLSSMYLLIITTLLSTYYLPVLSKTKSKKDLYYEIRKAYIFLIPIVITVAIIIFYSRGIIVSLLFDEKFIVMEKLFKWQLIGDVIKVCSCLLSYIILAKTMTRVFIITELISASMLTLLSMYFIDNYGFVGLSYAYAMSNFIYFLMIFIIIVWFFIQKRGENE